MPHHKQFVYLTPYSFPVPLSSSRSSSILWLLDPVDRGIMLPQNMGNYLPVDTV